MSTELADMAFQQYMSFCQLPLENMSESLRKKVLNVLVPLLSKLSTKASLHNLLALHEVQQSIYENYPRYLDRDVVNVIYENLPLSEYTKVQLSNLKLPYVLDSVHDYDYPQLGFNLNQLTINDSVVEIIVEGLQDEHRAIQRMALHRANIALLANGEDEQKNRILQAVIDWRNQSTTDDLLRRSFEYAPEDTSKDIHKRKDLLKGDIARLEELSVEHVHGSEVLNTLENLLEYFAIYSDLLTDRHHAKIVSKFADLVLNNEKLLTKDDENEIFGGLWLVK